MNRSSIRLAVVLILAAVYARGPLPSAAGAPIVRTVAMTEGIVPGAPSGVVFRDFNPTYGSLNDAGQVAFIGHVTGSTVDGLNNEGIWSEGSGSLQLIARKGDLAPGAPSGAKYFNFAHTMLNNAGASTFWAGLIDSTFVENGHGVWSDASGALALVAGPGVPAPGTPSGVTFSGIGEPALNNAGQTAFHAGLAGNGVDEANDEGIWSEGPGSLTLLARQGGQAPGMPAGVSYDVIGSPVINDDGRIAFSSYVAGNGVVNQGVWSEGAGGLSLVASGGTQAPGAPAGLNYEGFSSPAFNNLGHTAFWGYLAGPAHGEPHDDGIWSEGSGSLELVARRGNPAPGMPVGVNFGSQELVTFDSPVLSDSGKVAFRGFVSGPGVDELNDEGIWSGDAGDLTLVARAGSHAPGTPPGVVFETFFPWNGALQLNAVGQSAFAAYLTGSGVDFGRNDIGIWATDVAGALHLIAREGDPLEVAPGDFRTIIDLNFVGDGTGNSDGRPSGINRHGQIAFWASFTGGEGIFVSNLVAIPEPTSLGLLALGLPFLVMRNSRHLLALHSGKTERRDP